MPHCSRHGIPAAGRNRWNRIARCRRNWRANWKRPDIPAWRAAMKRRRRNRPRNIHGMRTACSRWTSRWMPRGHSPRVMASWPSCGSMNRPRRGWWSPRMTAEALLFALFGPAGEGAAGSGQFTQQLRRGEVTRIASLRMLLESRQHRVEADLIGVEHRAAAPPRKSIAGGVYHVDIAGALRHALFEQLRTFVDHREYAALDDLLARDRLAAGDAELATLFGKQSERCVMAQPLAR